ncbi:hypothetical protein JL720_10632 [Aureococcus anophagefferens]|nr:hypothetical protein JL720_10632 [Aureococcus anophagefferens]
MADGDGDDAETLAERLARSLDGVADDARAAAAPPRRGRRARRLRGGPGLRRLGDGRGRRRARVVRRLLGGGAPRRRRRAVVSSAILAERDAEIAALKATVAAGADAAAERDVLADAREPGVGAQARPGADAAEGRNGALEAQVAALASSADPADDTTLRLRVAELEARNSTLEAQARRTRTLWRAGEASALQRRVDELAPLLAAEQEARAADVARLQGELERKTADLETEARRVASEAESVERDKGEQVAELEELRTSRRRLTRRTSEFSQTMKTLFAISDHIHDELVAGDDLCDDDDAKLGMMQQLLPVKVEELVAQRVTEAAASSAPTGDVAALEAKLAAAEAALRENQSADAAALEQKLAAAEAARDAAQKEADGAIEGREESLRQLAADADGAAEEAARAAAALAEAREPLERVTAERDAAVDDVRTVYADFQELQAQAQAMYGELEAARAQLAASASAPATPGPFDGGAAPAGPSTPPGFGGRARPLRRAAGRLVAAAEEAETDRKYRKRDSLRAFENAVKKLEAAEASAAEKQRAIDALEAGAEAAASRIAELEAAQRPVFDAAAALPGFPRRRPPRPLRRRRRARRRPSTPAGEPAPDLKEALSIVESALEDATAEKQALEDSLRSDLDAALRSPRRGARGEGGREAGPRGFAARGPRRGPRGARVARRGPRGDAQGQALPQAGLAAHNNAIKKLEATEAERDAGLEAVAALEARLAQAAADLQAAQLPAPAHQRSLSTAEGAYAGARFDAPAPGAFDAPAPVDASGAFDAPAPGAFDAPAPGAFDAGRIRADGLRRAGPLRRAGARRRGGPFDAPGDAALRAELAEALHPAQLALRQTEVAEAHAKAATLETELAAARQAIDASAHRRTSEDERLFSKTEVEIKTAELARVTALYEQAAEASKQLADEFESRSLACRCAEETRDAAIATRSAGPKSNLQPDFNMRVKQVVDDYNALRAELERSAAASRETEHALTQRALDLEAELAAARGAAVDLDVLAKATAALEASEASAEDARAERDAAVKARADASERYETSMQALTAQQEEFASALRDAIAQARDAGDALDDERARFEAEKKASREELRALERRLADQEVLKLTQDLADARAAAQRRTASESSQFAADLAEAKEALKAARSEAVAAKAAEATLTASLEKAREKEEALSKRLSDVVDEFHVAKKRLQAGDDGASVLSQDNDRLRRLKESLESDVADARKVSAALEAAVASLEAKLESTCDALRSEAARDLEAAREGFEAQTRQLAAEHDATVGAFQETLEETEAQRKTWEDRAKKTKARLKALEADGDDARALDAEALEALRLSSVEDAERVEALERSNDKLARELAQVKADNEATARDELRFQEHRVAEADARRGATADVARRVAAIDLELAASQEAAATSARLEEAAKAAAEEQLEVARARGDEIEQSLEDAETARDAEAEHRESTEAMWEEHMTAPRATRSASTPRRSACASSSRPRRRPRVTRASGWRRSRPSSETRRSLELSRAEPDDLRAKLEEAEAAADEAEMLWEERGADLEALEQERDALLEAARRRSGETGLTGEEADAAMDELAADLELAEERARAAEDRLAELQAARDSGDDDVAAMEQEVLDRMLRASRASFEDAPRPSAADLDRVRAAEARGGAGRELEDASAPQLEESLEASELDRLHGEFEAEQRLKDDLEGQDKGATFPNFKGSSRFG